MFVVVLCECSERLLLDVGQLQVFLGIGAERGILGNGSSQSLSGS